MKIATYGDACDALYKAGALEEYELVKALVKTITEQPNAQELFTEAAKRYMEPTR